MSLRHFSLLVVLGFLTVAVSAEGKPYKHHRTHTVLTSEKPQEHNQDPQTINFFDTHQPPADSAEGSTQKHSAESEDKVKWTDQMVAWSAVATAFLTFILAVSTYFLWKETRRLARETERSARISMKLQEGALAVHKRENIKEGENFFFPLIYDNVGSTNIDILYYDQFGLGQDDFDRLKANPIPVHLAGYGDLHV